jgi:outer membrane protein OmpA-like peptidoglycan-associated protein
MRADSGILAPMFRKLALCLALLVPVTAYAGGKKLPTLDVQIDRSHVDLEGHQLEVKLSRAAEKVKIKVIGESGVVLFEQEQNFAGTAAGAPLTVKWTPSSPEPVARIEVWGYDVEGYYAGVQIVPWSVSIPHEEVTFETASDVIRDSEAPKLEASRALILEAVKKHGDLGRITLFIAGHTDTVGTPDSNLALSRRRAMSIARWLRAHDVKLPMQFEGFGESSPLVKTGDEVDEPRNRRVDYILSLEPPRLSNAAASWKSL